MKSWFDSAKEQIFLLLVRGKSNGTASVYTSFRVYYPVCNKFSLCVYTPKSRSKVIIFGHWHSNVVSTEDALETIFWIWSEPSKAFQQLADGDWNISWWNARRFDVTPKSRIRMRGLDDGGDFGLSCSSCRWGTLMIMVLNSFFIRKWAWIVCCNEFYLEIALVLTILEHEEVPSFVQVQVPFFLQWWWLDWFLACSVLKHSDFSDLL